MLILILGSLWVGCNAPFAEVDYAPTTKQWNLQDTIALEFENADTSSVYRLSFPFRFTNAFEYNNLYLRARITAAKGEQNMIPTRFQLIDPIGNWFTEPDGEVFPFQLRIRDGLRFNQMGYYKIELYHYMQDSTLSGVASVGIQLYKVEQ